MAERAKLSVTLRIFGDYLDPTAITSLLPHAPTRSQRRGDVLTLSSGSQTAPKKTGVWSLSIHADGVNVDQTISLPLARLRGRAKTLDHAPGIDETQFNVFVIDDEKSMKHYRLHLGPELLGMLGKTRIPVEVVTETIKG